jgi:hypothetical protein
VTAVLAGHERGVNGLAYAPDGATLVSAGADGLLKLWDMPGQQMRQELRGHSDSVLAVAFFRQGQALVSGSGDGTARVWDTATGEVQFALVGHRDRIEAVAVAPGDQLLATASRDRTIRLWNAATGQETAVLHGHTAPVAAVAFTPDGQVLASAAADGTVHFWDVPTGELLQRLDKQAAAIRVLTIAPDGKSLVTGSAAGVVLLALQVGVADDDAPAKKELAQQYAQSFRGEMCPPGWELRGPDDRPRAQFEPAGLRITLPAGNPANMWGTGVCMPLVVQGDFEMSARFEVLQEPTPEGAGTQTRVSLEVVLDKPRPQRNMASITRRVTDQASQFFCWQVLRGAEADDQEQIRAHSIRTAARTGQLRLKRTGTTMFYFIAEGDEGEFVLLRQFPFGTENLREVRLVGSTGGPRAALDARFTDFQVRAEALGNLAGMQELPPPSVPKERGAGRFLVGLVFAGVLAASLGLWLFEWRRRAKGKHG